MNRPYMFATCWFPSMGKSWAGIWDTPQGERAEKVFDSIAFGESPHYKHQGWLFGDTTKYKGSVNTMDKNVGTEPFNAIFLKGGKNEAYAQYFVGQSYLNMLTTSGVTIGNVTFEPGCRNNWHIHHKGGQILLCTAGRGYFQEWGKAPQALRPGDVVNIPAEVKHWHGAAPDSWFAHLAVEVPVEDGSNEWLEPVDDDEYTKLDWKRNNNI